ncbi:MAG: FAD-binding oxidoreductase, partial [Planctomycetes bacterium]|nr:FAD-binding oxidoreductase [Planctomycetota bacterium]
MSKLEKLSKYCELTSSNEMLDQYSTDESIFRTVPTAVCFPRNSEEVSQIVQFCSENQVALIPRGGGSGIAGQSIGSGIIMDFKKYMNKIVGLNSKAKTIMVEPGVIHKELNDFLKPHGLFFPPDPSSMNFCCIGGNISTNAGGIHTVKYGSTKDYIEYLEVILSDGSKTDIKPTKGENGRFGEILSRLKELHLEYQPLINKNKPHVIKNSSGYNVFEFLENEIMHPEKLICGSEGTLAVVTKITLRLKEIPKARALVALHFETIEAAGSSAALLLKLNPSALEIIDETALAFVHQVFPEHLLDVKTNTVLLCEFAEENQEAIDKKLGFLTESVSDVLHSQVETGSRIDRLWELRRAVSKSLEHNPGPERPMRFIEDCCVHPTKVREYITRAKEIVARQDLKCAVFGHAGDGNIHINVFADPKNPLHLKKIGTIYAEVI